MTLRSVIPGGYDAVNGAGGEVNSPERRASAGRVPLPAASATK
jgi:hypothetical protein